MVSIEEGKIHVLRPTIYMEFKREFALPEVLSTQGTFCGATAEFAV